MERTDPKTFQEIKEGYAEYPSIEEVVLHYLKCHLLPIHGLSGEKKDFFIGLCIPSSC